MSPSPVLTDFHTCGAFCSISHYSVHTTQKQTIPSFKNAAPEVSPLTGVWRQILSESLCSTYNHGNSCYVPDTTGSSGQSRQQPIALCLLLRMTTPTKSGSYRKENSTKITGITLYIFQDCFRERRT